MKTLEQLLAMIEAGHPVILAGEHLTTKAQVEAAYPAAAEANKNAQAASPQALVAGIVELRQSQPAADAVTKADLEALHDRIVGAMVPRSEHEALQASIAADYVAKADADALVTRNGQQADLLDALTAPERLAALDEPTLGKVAAFVGAKPGKTPDETLKAIAAKRGA